MTRYRWVTARKAEGFPTTLCCDVAGVSRQAFYGWRAAHGAGPTDRASESSSTGAATPTAPPPAVDLRVARPMQHHQPPHQPRMPHAGPARSPLPSHRRHHPRVIHLTGQRGEVPFTGC